MKVSAARIDANFNEEGAWWWIVEEPKTIRPANQRYQETPWRGPTQRQMALLTQGLARKRPKRLVFGELFHKGEGINDKTSVSHNQLLLTVIG